MAFAWNWLNCSNLITNLILFIEPNAFKSSLETFGVSLDRITASFLLLSSQLVYLRETFTLLSFNNILAIESSFLIDFSLLIGNQILVYVSGLLAVYNLLYRAARTNLLLFFVISV